METPSPTRQVYNCKILVLGEPNVGKTSYVCRYVYDTFNTERRMTIKVDFTESTFRWDDNTQVNLRFWDVAGQERSGTQSSIFFRGAHAAIIVYDATDEDSYKAVPIWRKLVTDYVRSDGEPSNIPCILLANKIDLVCDKSEDFDPTELNLMTKTCDFAAGIPISACGSYNIAQSVRKLVEVLLENQRNNRTRYDFKDDDRVGLRILDAPDLPDADASRCGRC